MAVLDPRHIHEHLMVLGCLHGASPREHSCYLGRRIRLPLRPPVRQMRTRVENIFSELRCAIPKLDKQEACRNSWISAEAWIIVNKRVSMRQEPGQDQRRLRRLGRAIWEAMKEDRRRREVTAGEDVEILLRGDLLLPHKV